MSRREIISMSPVGKGKSTPPQYDRVARLLSDEELRDELAGERAKTDEGWRTALEREWETRK